MNEPRFLRAKVFPALNHAPAAEKPSYRPDLDGLRGIAVSAVVVYHAFPNLLPGGFVGVDVFFVISGYLITSILLSIRDGRALANFYSRRVKRLFPALLVTQALLLLFGLLLLFPSELGRVAEQSLAASLFLGNVYFWLKTDYFTDHHATEPLLHLWSLGVEEQFYMVWPLVFLVLVGPAKRGFQLTIGLLLLSFTVNLLSYKQFPMATFYLPFGRFWELLIGAALATSATRLPVIGEKVGRILSYVALSVLLLSCGWISSENFPGWQAALPTLACATLIWCLRDKDSFTRQLLESRTLVLLGLISYPLYLYHWPLLWIGEILGYSLTSHKLLAVAIALLGAFLTYRYVEIPVRRSRGSALTTYLAGASLVLVCVFLLIIGTGTHGRLDLDPAEVAKTSKADWTIPWDNYKRQDGFEILWTTKRESNILIFGDSHASQYYEAFSTEAGPVAGRGVGFLTYGGCPPLPATRRKDASYACEAFYEFMLSQARSPAVDTIVLSAYWEHYYGFTFPNMGKEVVEPGLAGLDAVVEQLAEDVEELEQLGKNVIVVLPNPSSPLLNPNNAVSRWRNELVVKQVSRDEFEMFVQPVVGRIKNALSATTVSFLIPLDSVCSEGICSNLTPAGQLIYRDDHHLRSSFVRRNPFIRGQIEQIIEKSGR